MTAIIGRTPSTIIRSVALGFGRSLTDAEVAYIAWERTVFPFCDHETLMQQAYECFKGATK